MTNEIRDPQFAHYVDEQAEALSQREPSFRLRIVASIAATIVAIYGAFAKPEPDFLVRAFNGTAV